MLRSFLAASILVMATLLAACATNVRANPENQKPAGESLTNPGITATQTEKLVSAPPVDCPVTVPQDPPFVPPPPYDQLGFDGDFWHGSNSLWTAVPRDGTWLGLPYNSDGYTQKVFWWRDGNSISEEPAPVLTVTAERLDGTALSVTGSRATNASAGDIGSAMLVGMDFPTPGCWKITGKSGEEVELSFVVWISP